MRNTATGWGRAGFWGGIALFGLGFILYVAGTVGHQPGDLPAVAIGLCRFAAGVSAVGAIVWALGCIEDQLKIIAAKAPPSL